ncbi:MAG: proline--tRNA ligase [Candidatus Omnitrophica bacterium]|nr:proline--tRNA ligase [Candidatus Omnitrophota bacterium]
MKWSESLIPTLRETPKEAEATSHQLMLRAGLVRKLSSGVYSYLPLGYRALEKIEHIIREEMNRSGACELLLPALHPSDLWKKTGRYEALGEDKISFKNRSGQEFVLGPTHEEVVTDLVAGNVKSYRELPIILYQIQTKFRDEARPRFGIIRSKEFMMKDAYSFDRSWEDLDQSYALMLEAYKRIFTRSGLAFEIVNADPGIMGGNVSHEFMLLADFGEDWVACCNQCDLRSAPSLVACSACEPAKPGAGTMEIFDTPGISTIEELTAHFKIPAGGLLKTILYVCDGKPVACLIRADMEISESKLKKFLKAESLMLAEPGQIEKWTGARVGFSGPVGLSGVELAADYSVRGMSDFVTGANQNDKHFKGVNHGRDFQIKLFGDFRTAVAGDLCPHCSGGVIQLKRAMEIGHIFKLGTRYSKPLGASFLDESGVRKEIIMGCYGIGVTRMIAGAIEQHHDEKGIVWPVSVAPFLFHLAALNPTAPAVEELAGVLYSQFPEHILFDDRNERAGVKFNDADLIGLPYQVIVGEKNAKEGKAEIRERKTGVTKVLSRAELIQAMNEILRKK